MTRGYIKLDIELAPVYYLRRECQLDMVGTGLAIDVNLPFNLPMYLASKCIPTKGSISEDIQIITYSMNKEIHTSP